MPRNGRGTAWLAGLVLGSLDGLVGAELPVLGLILIALAAVVLGRRGGAAAIGGLLLGAGGIWAVILLNAVARCAAFDALPDQECVMGDVTAWVVGSIAVAAVGLGLSLAATRRGR